MLWKTVMLTLFRRIIENYRRVVDIVTASEASEEQKIGSLGRVQIMEAEMKDGLFELFIRHLDFWCAGERAQNVDVSKRMTGKAKIEKNEDERD